MNEFEVRFYDAGGVLQSTIENDNIFDLNISEKSIGSINSFLFEPQRVKFECFKTDWIQSYLLPVEYQSEKNISIYYMNIFLNGTVKMNAYIDLSLIDSDDKTKIIKIVGYSFVGLLNVFSDMATSYDLYQGIRLPELLEVWAERIEDVVGFNVHIFDYYVQLYISVGAVIINTDDCIAKGSSAPYSTTNQRFAEVYSAELSENFWYFFRYISSNSHKEEEYDEWYVSSRTLQVWRVISPMQYSLVDEVSINSTWDQSQADPETSNDIITLLTLYLGDGYNFNALPTSIEWSANKYLRIVDNKLQYTGLITASDGIYYMGLSYESSDRPGWTPASTVTFYGAMKALCMLNNNIVVEKKVSENSNGGGIQIQPKTVSSGTSIVIDDEDIISSKRHYFSKINAPFSDMDALSGNISTYKEQMGIYYNDFLGTRRGKDFIIDKINKYVIEPFNTITVKSVDYQVYSVGENIKEDEYDIIGVEI